LFLFKALLLLDWPGWGKVLLGTGAAARHRVLMGGSKREGRKEKRRHYKRKLDEVG
jgi:hypothetical protein